METLEQWQKRPFEERAERVRASMTIQRILMEKPHLKTAKDPKTGERIISPETIKAAAGNVRIMILHPEEAKPIQYFLEHNEKPPLRENSKQKSMPWVSGTERQVLKNFGQDKGAMLRYLNNKKGTRNIIYDGQIWGTQDDGENWYPLDPEGVGEGSLWDKTKEFAQDVGDIATDIGQAGAETAGGAVGGIAGGAIGLLGGAPGAFAGAMTGGALGAGSASAASQYLRSLTGQLAGLEQEPTWKEAGEAFKTGALSTGIFGTGATKPLAKSMLKSVPLLQKAASAAQKRGSLTDRELMQRLMEAQSSLGKQVMRGGSERSVGLLGSSLDDLTGGIRDVKALKEYRPEYKSAYKLGPAGAAEQVYENARDTILDRKKDLQAQLERTLNKYGQEIEIDAQPIRNSINNMLDELQTRAITDAERESVRKLRNQLRKVMPTTPSGYDLPTLSATEAIRMKMVLGDVDKMYKQRIKKGDFDVPGEAVGADDFSVNFHKASVKSKEYIDQKIDQGISTAMTKVDVPVSDIDYATYLKEWRKMRDAERTVGKKEAFTSKIMNTASESNTAEKFRHKIKKVDEDIGTDLESQGIGISLAQKFGSTAKPTPGAKGGGGLADNLLRASIGGVAGSAVGGGLGYGLASSLGITPDSAAKLGAIPGGIVGMALANPRTLRFVARANNMGGRVQESLTPGPLREFPYSVPNMARRGIAGNIQDIVEPYAEEEDIPVLLQKSPYFNMKTYRQDVWPAQ